MRLVVLGGGLSGLSYIHYLRNFLAYYKKTHLVNKVTLLEANSYMGGSVKTNIFDDGVVHELGPRSIRYSGAKAQNTGALIEQLGLSDQVVSVTSKSAAGSERYVYRDGGLHIVPVSIVRLFKKLPASNTRLISCVKKDLFGTEKLDLDKFPYRDPSLYEFVAYRFGEDAAEAVLDPLLRGITAGDARKLSTRALFGDMMLLEQAYGSVIKGSFRPPLSKQRHDELFPHDVLESKLLDKFQKESVISFNLRSGLQTLPEHLCNSLLNTNEDGLLSIYNSTQVSSVQFNNTSLDQSPCSVTVNTVDGDELVIEADHIVSTIPAKNFAQTIPESMPAEQKKALENILCIEHAPVGCVALEYRDITKDLPKMVNSFGYLTHSKAGSRALGVSFDTTMFPEIDKKANSFRMTCMMGGAWWKEVFETDNLDTITDAKMEQIALEEVSRVLKIKAEPHRVSSLLWRTGIAQYTPGHKERVEEAREKISKLKMPLTLLGQSYDGVAVNDVIFSARLAANDFVQSL